jgi:hypothetical protein
MTTGWLSSLKKKGPMQRKSIADLVLGHRRKFDRRRITLVGRRFVVGRIRALGISTQMDDDAVEADSALLRLDGMRELPDL